MKKKVVVLISGRLSAGKTTVAGMMGDFLQTNHWSFDFESFAKPLKNTATYGFGWDGQKDKKGRRLLQDIGNIGRSYNIDLWVDLLHDRIYLSEFDFVIVDDWRFPNEFEYLKLCDDSIFVVTVRVINDHVVIDNDISEVSLEDYDLYDYIIVNNDDLKNLRSEVNYCIGDIIDKYREKITEGEC